MAAEKGEPNGIGDASAAGMTAGVEACSCDFGVNRLLMDACSAGAGVACVNGGTAVVAAKGDADGEGVAA